MFEEAGTILWRNTGNGLVDNAQQTIHRPLGQASQNRFRLRPYLLVRIEIRRIRRKIQHPRADAFDRFARFTILVAAKIVHHHDIVDRQSGDEKRFDPGPEPFGIHRTHKGMPGEYTRKSDGRHRGRGNIMPVRDKAIRPLAAKRSSVGSLPLGVRVAFVKENQMVGRNIGDGFGVPAFTFFPDVGTIPFLGDGRFFYA